MGAPTRYGRYSFPPENRSHHQPSRKKDPPRDKSLDMPSPYWNYDAKEFENAYQEKVRIARARGRVKPSKEDLTSRLSSIITIAGFVGGIFFLSNNITGNVVGNMTNSTSNFLGAGLLIIGLVAGFFWVKQKKS